jgi:hypothetical protein
MGPLADSEVQGAGGSRNQWDNGGLVALADDLQRAVATLETEVLDVRTARLADAHPVEAQQHGERGMHRRDPLGRVQQTGEFAAIHAALRRGMDLGAADVLRRVGGNPAVEVGKR